jgi:glycolate oxidase iron-sulfur subunit
MNNELNLCVRCGSCKALCPTYIEDATEGLSARGRIMLLKKFSKKEISPSNTLHDRIFSCILCGACNSLCPLGINITEEIYDGRKKLRKFSRKSQIYGLAAKLAFKKATASFRVLKIMDNISRMFPVMPFISLGKIGISLPDSSLKDGMTVFRVARPKGRIAVFAGCSVNFLYPNIGMSLINSLNSMGYDVILSRAETCCGAPLISLGLQDDAVELAEKNIGIFEKLQVEAVIGLCPTCVHFIKTGYIRLIGKGVSNAVEVSQFFSAEERKSGRTEEQKLKTSGLPSFHASKLKVIYHAPCHSVYNLKTGHAPEQILKAMGLSLIEPKDRGCCGFGGTFRLLYKKISGDILKRRLEDYKEADMIVTSCPNCIIQLRTGIKDKPVKHIIEVIEDTLKKGNGNEKK